MCVPVYQLEVEYFEAEEIFLANGRVIEHQIIEIWDKLQRFSTYGNAPISDEKAQEIREKLKEMKTPPVRRRSILSEEWKKMEDGAIALY